jgi:hypothetical protein
MDSFILSYKPYLYKKRIDSTSNQIMIFIDIASNLFRISDSSMIKKFRGGYYFNSVDKLDRWECFQVLYKKRIKELSLNTFTNEDYMVLNRLMKVNKDIKDEVHYCPSMKSFRMFLRLNGFERNIRLKKK